MVRIRCGSLSILGHSLRIKIPIVGNQGDREAGSRGWFELTEIEKCIPSGPERHWGLHTSIHTRLEFTLAQSRIDEFQEATFRLEYVI